MGSIREGSEGGPQAAPEDRRFLAQWQQTCEYAPDDPKYGQSLAWNLGAVARGDGYADHVERYRPLRGARVLDVGCGSGGVAIAFARRGAACVGLEPAAHRFAWAQVRTADHGVRVELIGRTLEDAPLVEGSFDVVLAIDVLEHVADYRSAARRMCRLLAEAGVLLATVPNPFHIKNIVREHHSGLFGVLLLPPSWRETYVVKVRRAARAHPVSRFPSPGALARTCREEDVEILEPRRLRVLQRPGELPSRWQRGTLAAALSLPVTARLAEVAYAAAVLPHAYTLVARRPSRRG